ncbi:MAG: FKBP-type peptidyl-prolyl cis-trans isomerase [Bacteroidia bacterium]
MIVRPAFLFFCLFIFLFQQAHAKRLPKWKNVSFQTSSSGLQYHIHKQGRKSIYNSGDFVVFDYVWYAKKDHRILEASQKQQPKGMTVQLGRSPLIEGFIEAMVLIGEGGKIQVQIPPPLGYGTEKKQGEDTLCYIIRIRKIMPASSAAILLRPDSIPTDTLVIKIEIPKDEEKIGDTLFSAMRLVEVPKIMAPCGLQKVMVMLRFRITWFENGVQRKDILVAVECPLDVYGSDFFKAGELYAVTAIPLRQRHQIDHRIMDGYATENLERYFGLRIGKN